MPSCPLSPNNVRPVEFNGYLLNEFPNSPASGSTISNEQRMVSAKFPSISYSSSPSSHHPAVAVGSQYKTHSEYYPSPNVHPHKTLSEAPSPLSIFSPSFARTSLFSSPGETSGKNMNNNGSSSNHKLPSKRDQVQHPSPSRNKKRMKSSDSNRPHIYQFNRIAYATLPLSERLAPQKENDIFLSTPNRSFTSTYSGTKDFHAEEQSIAHYNQDMPNGSKPFVATSSSSVHEEVDGIPTGVMLKRRINAVNVILQNAAIVQERKSKECSSTAEPTIPTVLPREKETSKTILKKGNAKIINEPCKDSSFEEITGNCEENLEIRDSNDLTSVAVSLLKMASG